MTEGPSTTVSWLRGLGLSRIQAEGAEHFLGPDTVLRVSVDPWVLMSVPGIGLRTADRAATAWGLSPTDPRRLAALVGHTLDEMGRRGGHLYGRTSDIVEGISQILSPHGDEGAVSPQLVAQAIRAARAAGSVVDFGGTWYSKAGARADLDAGRMLRDRLRQRPPTTKEQAVAAVTLPGGLQLSDEQTWAVVQGLSSPVSVITGGPGTGKTTCLRTLLDAADALGLSVELVAPTGAAARRLMATTDRPAATIHRRLHVGRPPPPNPCSPDILVVDEMSMVDGLLLHALLDRTSRDTALVLVGDVDQLPSVGPGLVLAQIIGSGVVPTARLTRIYRQAGAAAGGIPAVAQAILAGEPGQVLDLIGGSVEYRRRESPTEAAAAVIQAAVEHPQAVVMTPSHMGPCGTVALNRALQALLNPGRASSRSLPVRTPGKGGDPHRARDGDRVMVVQNSYGLPGRDPDEVVANGQTGVVVEVTDEGVTVVLDGDPVPVHFDRREAQSKLALAYCSTVHKMQGQEAGTVILALPSDTPPPLLSRSVLYTGLTRARSHVIIVGAHHALVRSVIHHEVPYRRTRLAEILRQPVDSR